ncbi:fungal-specific transcription factor domain-containing protein [Lactarius sanguifluus]|nr:fungal-specific transcription factor domain-containing protein [Lactarius sanguifluus]
MKCTFPPGENVCKRCKTGKHDCIVEGRKPRSAPNKREYLLAQMKQKDAIIESLLKQLHNPYLATPLSIEAYRMATPSSDHHRDTVIAWLDRLQSSVRSPPVRSGPAKNPFQLDTHAGESEESDDERTQQQQQQQHVPPRRGSSGSDDSPVSPNTLVEADIDAYADDSVPIGLLASLAISTSKDRPAVSADKKGRDNADDDDDDVGVASRRFFMPGPSQNLALRKSLIDKISPPDILVHKLVTPEDVEKLFDIFYTRINPFISLLDPKLHTPALTFSRCPFLFTVVCAIASRYSDKPEVYPIAMHFAKSAAANALVDGWKSVELCQAYILMSIYAVPARRWEEDRSWLYTGLAIRIATDLNLHLLPQKKPTTEQQELEMLNRTRVWIICFNLDKSTATQFGKPSTLKEDYIMRRSLEWYKASNHNHPYDVHIIAYSSLFRIINQFHQKVFSDLNVPNGLNRSIDFREVTLEYDQLLHNCREEWAERFARDSDPNDPACEFRAKLLPFYSNYAMLVMFSFGFQEAFLRGFQAGDEFFFSRSLDCAKTVVTVLVDTLVPTGYIRFAPDGYFVFAAFASAFMLKLLRPECSRFITPGLETEIYQVIERLINTIGSPQIAIDERHTPMLYSRFLASLLAKHRRDGAAHGRLHQHGPPTQQPQVSSTGAPAYQQQRQTTQQGPPSHSANPSSFATGGNPTTVPDAPSAATLNGSKPPPTVTQSANRNEPMHQVETPSYTFGATTAGQPGSGSGDANAMDFTFDISIDELLGPMKAIENPLWMQTMMLPGFSWPTDESYAFFGNNMAGDGFQNYMAPQPTAVHLG